MRAVARRGPAPGGQYPHRAREGGVRGAARSARRDGRTRTRDGLFATDRGERVSAFYRSRTPWTDGFSESCTVGTLAIYDRYAVRFRFPRQQRPYSMLVR